MPPPATESSTIRDRLANERTLLAWIRTGLSFMALGLIIARFAWLARVAGIAAADSLHARVMGVVLVLVGSATVGVGAARTRAYARIIDPGGSAPRDSVLYVSAVVVALLGVAMSIEIALA